MSEMIPELADADLTAYGQAPRNQLRERNKNTEPGDLGQQCSHLMLDRLDQGSAVWQQLYGLPMRVIQSYNDVSVTHERAT